MIDHFPNRWAVRAVCWRASGLQVVACVEILGQCLIELGGRAEAAGISMGQLTNQALVQDCVCRCSSAGRATLS